MDTALARRLQHARRLGDEGRREDSIAAYRELLAQAPGHVEAWYELAWLLRRQGQPQSALEAYARALANGIAAPEDVHLNRAVIQTDDLHDHAAAEASLRAALALKPGHPPALLNLGNLCEDLGRDDEAEACYRALLATETRTAAGRDGQAEALARLLALPALRATDAALLERALATARRSESPSTGVQANLWFAIGRALEARQDHGAAFEAFVEGNRLAARGGPAYSPAGMEAAVDALVASLAARPRAVSAAPRPDVLEPLFICGMFRSGSTLIEQVLAAHPQVLAGGERPFFPALAGGPLAPYPARLAALDDARCAALAGDYLAHRARLAPAGRASARWFTDKRPDNVLLLDLVKRVFPLAKILLTRRDPIDTGLSVFQQHLDQRQAPYSSDLRAIGHYSGQLQRWVGHCKAAFGADLRVFDYDAFVRDPEAELRPLLDWLGLDWDPRCLAFHSRESSVKTASVHQVRRPLYADSSGRWRPYAQALQPMIDELRKAGLVD